MSKFKCVESKEHVAQTNVTREWLHQVMDYYHIRHKIPMPYSLIRMQADCYQDMTDSELHDVGHMIIDELITQYDNGHYGAFVALNPKQVEGLRAQQHKCKGEAA